MALEPSPYDSLPIPPEFRRQGQGSPSSGPLVRPPVPVANGPRVPPVGEPIKFTSGKAVGIGERFPLSEQAALLLTPELTPKRYVEILTEKSLYADAMRILAFGLPKRDAVWWACLCLREAQGAQLRETTRPALEAAEKWAKTPIEENRRPGLKAADAAGFGTPAGLVALAAFWSGGSLTPPGAPVVPPAEHMTAEAVAGAVLLAATGALPDDVSKRQRRFLALGLSVACGR